LTILQGADYNISCDAYRGNRRGWAVYFMMKYTVFFSSAEAWLGASA